MSRKTKRRDRSEDLTVTLTYLIGTIDVTKNAVPIQLGQGILATTSAILVLIKVRLVLRVSSTGNFTPVMDPFRTQSKTKKTFATLFTNATGSGDRFKRVIGRMGRMG
jgi:hypothetical protein